MITRQEIEKSGATSITEALRLCPALIVTEMTNGNHQVDIRGFNNLPPFENSPSSKTILVMIDNRAIYNQLQGGTYWESLPIDLNDIERIEVVAGPNAALFGPNAANGVINMITRNPQKTGVYGLANAQADYRGTYIGNLSIGHKLNEKLSIHASVNYQLRNRNRVDFYEFRDPVNGPGYVNSPNDITPLPGFAPGIPPLVADYNTLFPRPSRSLDKKGANLYANYDLNEKVKFGVNAGWQDAEAMRQISIRGAINTPLNDHFTRSTYVRAHANVHGFSTQVSYLSGNQGFLKGLDQYQYKFATTDAYLDYTFSPISKLSFKPALSYQNAVINDLPYTKDVNKTGLFNNNAQMTNIAGSLRGEFEPIKQIRLIAAARADNFTYPKDKWFISYQFVANIKPSENHNIRLIYSKAYSGSYIFNTYVDFDFVNIPQRNPTTLGILSGYRPNREANPAHVILYELGHRAKVTEKLSTDVALFMQEGRDFISAFNEPTQISFTQIAPGVQIPSQITNIVKPDNMALKVTQLGMTLGLNWVLLNNKMQLKPFVTLQTTRWENYSPYINKPEVPINPAIPVNPYNTSRQYSFVANNTPTAFGGFFFSYEPINKLNVSLNTYYFSAYKVFTNWESNPTPTADNPDPLYTEWPTIHIKEKLLLNAKVSYNIVKYTKLFVNVRNIIGTDSREFYGTDRIGALYMAGVNFDLNK